MLFVPPPNGTVPGQITARVDFHRSVAPTTTTTIIFTPTPTHHHQHQHHHEDHHHLTSTYHRRTQTGHNTHISAAICHTSKDTDAHTLPVQRVLAPLRASSPDMTHETTAKQGATGHTRQDAPAHHASRDRFHIDAGTDRCLNCAPSAWRQGRRRRRPSCE